MSQGPKRSANGKANILLIAGIVAAALILILLSRTVLAPKEMDPAAIQEQLNALQPPSPAPAQAAGTSAPDAAPAASATNAQEAEAYLFIILNNRVWGIEPLGEERDVTVDQGDGVVNVIHLLPDGFYMASSTCENQLCVSEGTVTVENYQRRILGASVLCLPHNLDLELVVPSHTPDPNAPDI